MLLLAIMIGIVGLVNLDNVNNLLSTQYDSRLVPIRDLAQAGTDLGNLDSAVQRTLTDPVVAHRAGYVASATQAAADIDRQLADYAPLASTSADEVAGL